MHYIMILINLTHRVSLLTYVLIFITFPTFYYFQVALDTSYWTWLNHLAIWGSLIFYFVLQFGYNYALQASYIGTMTTVSPKKFKLDEKK